MKEFQSYMHRSQRSNHWTVLNVSGEPILYHVSEAEAWGCFLHTHGAGTLLHWKTVLATQAGMHVRKIDGALAPSSPTLESELT